MPSIVCRGTLLIRVLALLPYPAGRAPGQRYRIEQWAPRLRAEGIELTFSPFLSPEGMDVLYRRGRAAAKARETVRGSWRRLRELLRPAGHHVVPVVNRPSTTFKTTTVILAGSAGCLHNAVQCYERDCD